MYCVVLTASTDRFSLFLSLSPPYYCKRAQICGGYNGERLPRIRGRKKKEVFALLRRKRDTSAGAVKQNANRDLSFSLCSSSFSRFFFLSFLELFSCVRVCSSRQSRRDVQWKLTPSTRAHAHITHLLSSSSSTKEWEKKRALRERGRGRRRRR